MPPTPLGESLSTLTLTNVDVNKPEEEKPASEEKKSPRLVLRLKARKHISFSEDTIDNEHLHKKKSKRCCIFHKRREFGESSTESEASTDYDSENSTKQRPRSACVCGPVLLLGCTRVRYEKWG